MASLCGFEAPTPTRGSPSHGSRKFKTPGQSKKDKVGRPWQCNAVNSNASATASLTWLPFALPFCDMQLDRFIPNRSGMDELPRFDFKENCDDESNKSPSKAEFSKLLASSLNLSTSEQSRILSFKHKAPAPPEHHQNQLAGLYSSNLGQAPNRKQCRHIPTTQDRILDGKQGDARNT